MRGSGFAPSRCRSCRPSARPGETRFDAGRLVRLGWDGLTSFSDLPLRVSGVVGAIVAMAAVGYGVVDRDSHARLRCRRARLGDVDGCGHVLSGLQLLFLGVLGQYVRNVFIETKQRPSYLVRELVERRAGDVAARREPRSRKPAAAAIAAAGRSAAV